MAVAAALAGLPGDTKEHVTQASLLSDELVRRLIGVGQVDIVVGVPTLNNVDTIAGTLELIDQGLMRYFPRVRTVVIGADGGSSDGTLALVTDAASAAAEARSIGLRTRHRIGASYPGVPGRAGAIRLIFTAADLLQAQAVAICDPDAAGLGPEWIGALLQPISMQSFDMVAGVPVRHPLEGLLVTQLVRPLMRAAYERQFELPLLGTFCCSRRFASGCLAHDAWDRSPIREGIELWLSGSALSGEYRVGQASLGRLTPPRRPGPGLKDVFVPLVGALFATLDRHAGLWLESGRALEVPFVSGEQPSSLDAAAPSHDAAALGATFFRDVEDLRPVLTEILAPDTFASLSSIADAGGDAVRYDDETWVATVIDFAAAHHHGVMDRVHIVQALMPLYLGRAASFAGEHAASPAENIERDLERLSKQFERRRPYLIDRWHRTT